MDPDNSGFQISDVVISRQGRDQGAAPLALIPQSGQQGSRRHFFGLQTKNSGIGAKSACEMLQSSKKTQ